MNKQAIEQWVNSNPMFSGLGAENRIEVITAYFQDLEPQWVSVYDSKPKQGERVLLRTSHDEHCPYVVGYWGSGVWEACTANVVADEDYNGNIACIERSFMNEDVTHWQPLPTAPEVE